MWIHRMIRDVELETAWDTAVIVNETINEMRRNFYPIEPLDTRIFRHHSLGATCIQISIPGSCSPQNPHGEVLV